MEAVTETVEKQRVDGQWNKYREANEKGKSTEIKKPSQKQIAYIVYLAKTAGLRVDVSKIEDNAKASSMIERLKQLSKQMNGSNGYELRDKRVAFGMATKLVFKKYLDRHKEFRKSKKFWQEVEELYREYQKNQERAIMPSSS